MAEETKQQPGRFSNRKQDEVRIAAPGRVNRAKKAGPHGSSTSADGTPYLSPLNKKKVAKETSGDGVK